MSFNESGNQLLSDIKIVDLSQAIFGAGATQLLGDLGAQIVKVEPPWGEMMRRPRTRYRTLRGLNLNVDDPDTGPWLAMNRNKQSIALNLKDERSREICARLIAGADIVIHNFRLGRMDEIGLGYDAVRAINERIVYVELSAFGSAGPIRRWAGGDMWAQAIGGSVSINGDSRSGPSLIPLPIADQTGAVISAFAIMAALEARERTGESQLVQTSLIDSVLHIQSGQLADYLVDDVHMGRSGRGWRGSFPFGAYSAADGDVVIIHGQHQDDWRTVCTLLGLTELLDDPELATEEQRRERRFALYPLLDAAFAKKSRAQWQAEFRAAGLRCDPCLTYPELEAHPQIAANEQIKLVEHPTRGQMKYVAAPYWLNGRRPTGAGTPPPRIGEHSRAVLAGIGYGEDEIDELLAAGVVYAPAPVAEAS